MKRPVEHLSQKRQKLTKHGSASDAVHRIIPLGLTLGEARAWYVNRVLIPRLRWAIAVIIAGFIVLLPMLTGLGQLLEQSLTTHMVVHDSLFLVAGFLLTYGANSLVEVTSHLSNRLWRARDALNRSRLGGKAFSILTFGSAGSLIAYWYLPAQFNAAAVDAASGTEMHVAFLSRAA